VVNGENDPIACGLETMAQSTGAREQIYSNRAFSGLLFGPRAPGLPARSIAVTFELETS
jgi:hypothetical protein